MIFSLTLFSCSRDLRNDEFRLSFGVAPLGYPVKGEIAKMKVVKRGSVVEVHYGKDSILPSKIIFWSESRPNKKQYFFLKYDSVEENWLNISFIQSDSSIFQNSSSLLNYTEMGQVHNTKSIYRTISKGKQGYTEFIYKYGLFDNKEEIIRTQKYVHNGTIKSVDSTFYRLPYQREEYSKSEIIQGDIISYVNDDSYQKGIKFVVSEYDDELNPTFIYGGSGTDSISYRISYVYWD